jgi:hypothetical protein
MKLLPQAAAAPGYTNWWPRRRRKIEKYTS